MEMLKSCSPELATNRNRKTEENKSKDYTGATMTTSNKAGQIAAFQNMFKEIWGFI